MNGDNEDKNESGDGDDSDDNEGNMKGNYSNYNFNDNSQLNSNKKKQDILNQRQEITQTKYLLQLSYQILD